MRLSARTFATYDAAAFLDTRAPDLGSRAAVPYKSELVGTKDRQRVEIVVAIVAILATVSFIVLLVLKTT